jgi:hypothetical protein
LPEAQLAAAEHVQYNKINQLIHSGQYKVAWSRIQRAGNGLKPAELFLLRGRMLQEQGASFLALEDFNAAERLLRNNLSSLLYEQLLMWRAEVFYQQFELQFYLREVNLLDEWRKRFRPADSLRKAMAYTSRARYFSAMIDGDSARYYTCRAVKLCRKFRKNRKDLPLWHIYSNHVSCLRNGFGFPSDQGPDAVKFYADTCYRLLNEWYPIDCMEKVRTWQALTMPYFDRISGQATWKKPTPAVIAYYGIFIRNMQLILSKYRQLAGTRHTYIATVEYLLGLVEFAKGRTEEAVRHLRASHQANYSWSAEEAVYCLNWQRMLFTFRFLPHLENSIAPKPERLAEMLRYSTRLEQAEEVFFLRYLFLYAEKPDADNDVYDARPFAQLSFVNKKLYKITGRRRYLEKAWDYAQKNKYTELLRRKLLSRNTVNLDQQYKLVRQLIQQIRLKNDTILLYMNGFPFISSDRCNTIANRLIKDYKHIKESAAIIGQNDPFAAQFITGKPAYSTEKLQQKMLDKESAFLAVENYSNEKGVFTSLWCISRDSIWIQEHHWKGEPDYLPRKIISQLENYQADSLEYFTGILFQNLFKASYLRLKNKFVTRLIYCDDPAFPLGNPESWMVSDGKSSPHFLLYDFAVSFQLLILPDAMLAKPAIKRKKSYRTITLCPKLPDEYVDLQLARSYADQLAGIYGANKMHQFVSGNQFVATLRKADIIQLFSHGDQEHGLIFSDRNITASEIRDLVLENACIGLTSCESYKGKLLRGEGVRGMAEAFLSAGARRVVSSLWKIDERSSAKILLNFYLGIKTGLPADVSLQQAKIQFIEQAVEEEQLPSYWSGIVLFGDTAPLFSKSKLNAWLGLKTILPAMIALFTLVHLMAGSFRFRMR